MRVRVRVRVRAVHPAHLCGLELRLREEDDRDHHAVVLVHLAQGRRGLPGYGYGYGYGYGHGHGGTGTGTGTGWGARMRAGASCARLP